MNYKVRLFLFLAGTIVFGLGEATWIVYLPKTDLFFGVLTIIFSMMIIIVGSFFMAVGFVPDRTKTLIQTTSDEPLEESGYRCSPKLRGK